MPSELRSKSVANGSRLLSVGEVAARLGVSTATVYKLVERGTLGHVRVSNAIRVDARALEQFIAAKPAGPA